MKTNPPPLRLELGADGGPYDSISKFRGMAELIHRFGVEAGQGLILEAQHKDRAEAKARLAKLTRVP